MKNRLRDKKSNLTKWVGSIYARIALHPHEYLSQHSNGYRCWHNFRFYKQVHIAIVSLAGLAVVLIIIGGITHNVFAFSSWVQSNWSGGLGSSTTNQYSAASNVTTSTPNQITLTAGSNEFSSSVINSSNDINNWLGINPTTIPGLELSVKADTDVYSDNGSTLATNGGTVEEWKDLSGNNNNFTQANSNLRPTYVANSINGRPAIHTSASFNQNLLSPINLQNSPFTVMYVGREDGPSRNRLLSALYNNWLLGWWNTAMNQAYFNGWVSPSGSPAADSGIYEYTGTSDNATTSDLYENGTLLYSNNGGINGPNGLGLTAYENASEYSDGDIAEILAYNNVLSNSNRLALDNYLQNKYDLNNHSVSFSSSTSYNGGNGSIKVTTGSSNNSQLVQSVNVGNTNNYGLSTFAYTNGSAVTSTNVQLYYNGSAIATTYTSVGNGWYELSAEVAGINASVTYGVQVQSNQTVYLDNFSLINYPATGTLTSSIYDASVASNLNNLSYTDNAPAGTSVTVKVRSGNQPNLSDAPAFTSCSAISNGGTSACAPNKTRYAQYQITLTGDGSNTPTFTSSTIEYNFSDTTPPTVNASSIAMYRSNGGASVASDGWTNADPYFTWMAGQDNTGGSGIMGYCLYLGHDPTGNPITTEGDLGTSPLNSNGTCQFAVSTTSVDTSLSGYIGTALTSSNSPYYLNILAIDNADNVYNGTLAQFEFMFDNTPPTNPAFISAPSEFISSNQVTLTWPTTGSDAASDVISGVAGLQYRIGSTGTWYGANHNGNQDMTDLLPNTGSYTTDPVYDNLAQGNNLIYFRTWNNAGVVSSAYVTTVVKINTNAPLSPQNLTATPTTNTTNSFAFSWLPPATYLGSAGNITYCYTVNTLPNNANCTYTAAGQTSLDAGAYATEPGDNTFYVVAKDEAGNINYATATSVTFIANTPAPGIPLNLDIADISIKATSSWKLALSWNQPSTVGAGIATYKIFRSTDGTDFTDIASTAGTSYVDANLSQQIYHYKVEACDSANNCGGYTDVVQLLPTGKFTSPANLLDGPTTTVSTRTATISWITDRDSDSSVEYGLSTGNYFPTEAANTTQIISHSITLNNLNAGTTYYYRAQWADVDGNIGTSDEGLFTTLPAPTVSNVTVSGINLTTATIGFTSIGATAVQLEYGPGVFANTQILNTSTSASTYSIPLSGLLAGTNYVFKLNPFDIDGGEYQSPESHTFSTPPQPVITGVTFQPVPGALTGTEQMFWTTNVPATSQISYGLVGGTRQYQLNTTMTTSHEMTISNLTYSTQYSVTATSVDGLGNIANSDLQVFKSGIDTRPPVISDLTIQPSIIGTGANAQGQLVISWKTDKAGTSQVAYGQGSGGSYSSKTAENMALVNNHVVVVSDLSTSEVYHLQALSSDANGVQGVSADQTTIIGQASDNALGIVFNALQSIFGL